MRAAPLAVLLAFAVCLCACGGLQKVERRQGGHVEHGRRIPSKAYAWYGRARYLHRLGELDQAQAAYRAVLELDPRSGAAYAGLGSTYCATARGLASETFARGLRRAEERAPIYLARGHCELAWEEPALALESARLAFERDPASADASMLLARALTALGKDVEAARVLRGQRLYSGAREPQPTIPPNQAAVDHALARGDLPVAEARALEVMTKSDLAVRALAWGHRSYAEDLAALITAAASEDVTAWTVLLLTRGGPIELAGEGSDPGALPTCLWAERLRTDVGFSAAEAYLAAAEPAGPIATRRSWRQSDDPLLAACAKRLATEGDAAEPSMPTSARP